MNEEVQWSGLIVRTDEVKFKGGPPSEPEGGTSFVAYIEAEVRGHLRMDKRCKEENIEPRVTSGPRIVC